MKRKPDVKISHPVFLFLFVQKITFVSVFTNQGSEMRHQHIPNAQNLKLSAPLTNT
jgi:hypothetical protein